MPPAQSIQPAVCQSRTSPLLKAGPGKQSAILTVGQTIVACRVSFQHYKKADHEQRWPASH